MASDCTESEKLKDVLTCVMDQHQRFEAIKRTIENKNAIIFLGNTRSGKSTLVNYIIGAELEAEKYKKKGFKIKPTDNNNGPTILHGSLPCTMVPKAYPIPGSAEVVIDFPGFNHNKGVVQNVINALFIKQIKFARSVKFVLVFDIADLINDNIYNFIASLEQIQGMIQNFSKIKESFAIIFTKDGKNYTQEEIAELFRSEILNVNLLDVNKILIEHFATHNRLIGIFKEPSHSGKITSDLDNNITSAIQASRAVNVEEFDTMYGLSDRAKKILLDVYSDYTDSKFFEEELNKINEDYENYFAIDKDFLTLGDDALNTLEAALQDILTSIDLNLQQSNRSGLYYIKQSLENLLKEKLSREFKEKIQFIEMLDDSEILEENHKQVMFTNFVNSLTNLREKVSKLLTKINNQRNPTSARNAIVTQSRMFSWVRFTVNNYNLVNNAADMLNNVYTVLEEGAVAVYDNIDLLGL